MPQAFSETFLSLFHLITTLQLPLGRCNFFVLIKGGYHEQFKLRNERDIGTDEDHSSADEIS
jgi:hypothetical protein